MRGWSKEKTLLELVDLSNEARAHFNNEDEFKNWWNEYVAIPYDEFLKMAKTYNETIKH